MATRSDTTQIRELLLPEFDEEMALTRKALERIPEDKLTWKPHPRSGSLGWLANFLAVLPTWTMTTMQQDTFDMNPTGPRPERPKPKESRAEILEAFDKNIAEARQAIAAGDDAAFRAPWTLLVSGKKTLTRSRYEILRSMMLNHMVHHRAQLGVYFRLLDVPVPAIYGPTADENPWGPGPGPSSAY